MAGSKETTTTQKSETKDIWAPAKPYISDIMGRAQRAADNAPQLWGGPFLAGMDPMLAQSFGATADIASRNMGSAGDPYRAAMSGVANNGMTSAMASPLATMSGVSTGQNRVGTEGAYGGLLGRSLGQNRMPNSVLGNIAQTGGAGMAGLYGQAQGQNADAVGLLGGIAGQSGGPTAAETYLTDMAKGGTENPYLQQMLDANAARVSNRINSAMSGAGRTGSFGHGDALVRSMAEANNPLMSAAYEADQNRRLAATGQLDQSRLGANAQGAGAATSMAGIRQGDTGQLGGILGQMTGNQLNAASGLGSSNRADLSGAMGALGGMTGVQQTNIGNQLGAAGAEMGALQNGQAQAQNWAGMAPMLNNLQYDPAARLGAIGQYNQGRDQYTLDQQRAQFERQQNMPWEQLQKYTGIMGGLSPMIAPATATTGTGTATTRREEDPWKTALGLGMTGAGMFFGVPPGMGSAGGLLSGTFGRPDGIFGGGKLGGLY